MIQPAFLTSLQAEQIAPGTWRLLAPLVYRSAVLGTTVTVPTDFMSDGDSIPRWLPLVYAILKGVATAPAFLHDYLYQTHQAHDLQITRGQGDAVLHEAAGADGPGIVPTSDWQRWLLWSGVRIGGGWAWYTGPRRYSALRNYAVQDRRVVPR